MAFPFWQIFACKALERLLKGPMKIYHLPFLFFFSLAAALHAEEGKVPALLKTYCAPCHGADLQGVGGVFPNLWESELVKKKDVAGIVKFVIAGSGPDSKSLAPMPPRGGALDLSDEQIKEIAVYLTTHEAPKSKVVEVPKGMGVLGKNFGPLVGAAIDLGVDLQGARNISSRAFLVPLGENRAAGIVFDSDTMAYSAIWLDDSSASLKITGLPFKSGHQTSLTKAGQNVLVTGARNGWSHAGELQDPRDVRYEGYPPLGHLPKHWAHFKGHYLHNDKVVFKYTVGDAVVHDSPGYIGGIHKGALTRTLNISGAKPEKLILAEAEGATIEGGILSFTSKGNAEPTCVALAGASSASFVVDGNTAYLTIPKGDSRLKLYFWAGGRELNLAFKGLVGEAEDLTPYLQGGQLQWPKTFKTVGQLAEDDNQAYVLDRLTLPYDNEYEGRMRIGGFDFFADGQRAALSTWDGDVWIVSGIDQGLKNLSWKRYATGLHEPLGLKIVDDVIYTVGDNQITRLHDLNKDGEADFYENFNNDWELTEGFHAFCFDLHTGPNGDFYFSFGSPVRAGGHGFDRVGRHHGSIIRVRADGQEMSVYASGFRAPNGLGISPDGQLTCGDNEGSFVPASPIHWVEPGKFHGVVDTYHGSRKLKTEPIARYFIPMRPKRWAEKIKAEGGNVAEMVDHSEMPKPLAWLSKRRKVDNSGGGQVWAGEKWGPLSGEMLHLSYGQSNVHLVLKEEKNGLMQGGVVNLPFKLTSSAMRARVNPKDGQVYLSGLNGWQSNADKEGGFDRIRYTGKKLYMPLGLTSKTGALEIRFSQKLDKAVAEDVGNYGIQAWALKWSQDYGSQERPQKGFAISKTELLDDGKTVRLSIPDLRPVHMMEIQYKIKAADGQTIDGKIDNTLHSIK
jgi:cytochrome c5